MTRNQLHAGLALGSAFLMAGIVTLAPPIPPASAQTPGRAYLPGAGHHLEDRGL